MPWKILGAAGAVIGVYVVRHFFGTAASMIAGAALLFGWWLLHLYTERRLDGLYAQFQQLDDSQRAQALSELDPEIRKDIEKRIANEKTCQPGCGSGRAGGARVSYRTSCAARHCAASFGIAVTALPRFLVRQHRRLGWLGTSVVMVPILAWVWSAAREPVVSVFNGAVPRYVFSGRLFTEPFNIVHAGFALDQPTIGKWLFWFTVMAVTSLSCLAVVGWTADRTARCVRVAFGACTGVLATFLLCILSWPMTWLIQYIYSMGSTPKRVFALVYGVAGGLVVIGFVVWSLRNPRREDAQP